MCKKKYKKKPQSQDEFTNEQFENAFALDDVYLYL